MPIRPKSYELHQQLVKTWQLAWPVIVANMALPLLGLADAAILGHLSNPVYLAGVTAGGSLMAYVFWGFNFLGMGLSGFTSQALGAGDKTLVVHQLQRYALVASLLVSVVVACHPLLIQGGLRLLGAAADASAEARTYLSIRAFGIPAIVFNSMLLGFFIGLQNTRIGLYTLALTQLLNIGLNLLFVYGFGMQTAGIAIGTVISEYLGLMLILWHLRQTFKRGVLAKREATRWTLQLRDFLSIFQVSSHLFVRTFFLLTAFFWFNRMSAELGNTVMAANGILLAFFTLISHFLDGTAAAAEAQTGHAYGTKNPHQLRMVWLASALMNGLFMLSLTLLFVVFGNPLVQLLTDQADIRQLAFEVLPWLMILPLSGGIAFWLDGVFVGARRSRDMRNSVLAGFTLFVLASTFFASDNITLWLCFNGFFMARSLWLLTIFYKKMLRISADTATLN